MTYHIKTIDPADAEGQVKNTYDKLQQMFRMVPNMMAKMQQN